MPRVTLGGELSEMLKALDDEISVSAGRAATYALGAGRTTVLGDDTAFVEFPSADIEHIEEGQEVVLCVGPSEFKAEVIEARRTSLVLFVRGRVMVDGRSCRLKVDDSSLARAIRMRLDDVAAREVSDFSADRADALLSKPVIGGTARYASDVLNEVQCAAVASALNPGITYLWGPPGTGKTTTVAHAVAALVDAGLSVLLVSHTNAAVDLALIRCAERIEAQGALAPGRILRFGRGVPGVSEFRGGILTSDGALAALGVQHRDLLVELQREIDRAKSVRTRIDKTRDGEHVAGWDQRRSELEDVRTQLREHLGDLEAAMVGEAQLVGTTVHRAATGRLERTFDAVVVDEASMVSLPTAWLCLGLARTHALVAGDFRQLAPISQAESGAAMRMLKRSLFDRFLSAHPNVPVAEMPGLVALTDQHRMTEDIAELIGRVFYPEIRLTTAADVAVRQSGGVIPDLPEIAGLEFTSPQSIFGPGGTQFSPASAQILVGLLEAAVRGGATITRRSLLALSPYRAQASLLQKIAAEFAATRSATEPIGSTVHRAQGDEASTVYFDLTESLRHSKYGVGQWYLGEDLSSDTSRLMNVALSRARDQIVVLGDRYHVVRNMPSGGRPRRALETVFRYGGRSVADYLDSHDSGLRFQAWATGARAAAEADLAAASAQVAAYLPRLDDAAISFAAHLLHLTDAGVPVLLTLGPTPGQDWRDWSNTAEHLRASRLTIDLRSPMPFSGVIIDERILWTFGGSDGGMRTDVNSLASSVAQLLRTRPPAGVEAGRQSDECRRCGRVRVLVDTFYWGNREVQLRCPFCDGEPA